MESMGKRRLRANLVRRMGDRISQVIEQCDGDEEAVREKLEQTYGSWVLWLQLAMQLLPILIEFWKSLQDRKHAFRRGARTLISSLSMDVMHDQESLENIIQDYRMSGEEGPAEFLSTWLQICNSSDEELVDPSGLV